MNDERCFRRRVSIALAGPQASGRKPGLRGSLRPFSSEPVSSLCKPEMQDWLIPSGSQGSVPAHSPHTPAGPSGKPALPRGGERGSIQEPVELGQEQPPRLPSIRPSYLPAGGVSQGGAWPHPCPHSLCRFFSGNFQVKMSFLSRRLSVSLPRSSRPPSGVQRYTWETSPHTQRCC